MQLSSAVPALVLAEAQFTYTAVMAERVDSFTALVSPIIDIISVVLILRMLEWDAKVQMLYSLHCLCKVLLTMIP